MAWLQQLFVTQNAGLLLSVPVGVVIETVLLLAPVETGRNRQSILRRSTHLGEAEHRCFET